LNIYAHEMPPPGSGRVGRSPIDPALMSIGAGGIEQVTATASILQGLRPWMLFRSTWSSGSRDSWRTSRRHRPAFCRYAVQRP
jgi:hypothetical protein